MSPAQSNRSAWRWWICTLLLLASMINYMDRQTLANAAHRITAQFQLSQAQYGNLEWGFGWAFAVGSIIFGIAADRFSVRWIYPAVLLLWSVTGYATGLVTSYDGLLLCRTLLGFFEAGHWPCAVKTTQFLLDAKDRPLGNGLLQSGASLGAVVTPIIMTAMLTAELDSWRFAFKVVGACGLVWIPMWLLATAPLRGLGRSTKAKAEARVGLRDLLSRKMCVVLVVIACINTCWQTLRPWLTKFLIEGRGYTEAQALLFNSAYYIASDVGCIGAGAAVLWMARRRELLSARLIAFAGCATLAALTLLIPVTPKGWLLLAILLLVAAGSLGVFPVYHSLTQDISAHHQGKVTGIAGVAAWAFAPPAQTAFGKLIDRTGSFDAGLAFAGCLPLIAFAALWLFWPRDASTKL